MPSDMPDLSSLINETMKIEANALMAFAQADHTLVSRAIELIHASTGPLIVSGVGKSGHIGRKIASTFCSLGKRASFLHAAEASHGDLGIIGRDSVVLVLSNSGETTELSDLLYFCREQGIPIIGMMAQAECTLGRFSNIAIAYGKHKEACLNGLAPTTSTTLALAVGDALAIGVSYLQKNQPEDFRKYHPGGSLGSRLLSVGDVMRTGDDLPIVAPDTPMSEVILTITQKALGAAIVIQDGALQGIITDGDIRRNLQDMFKMTAGDVATKMPKTISPDMLLSSAAQYMTDNKISVTIVADDSGAVIGALHVHQCYAAR